MSAVVVIADNYARSGHTKMLPLQASKALRRGEIHPVVSERLPLTEVRRAHELLESSAATGKLVLVPEGPEDAR